MAHPFIVEITSRFGDAEEESANSGKNPIPNTLLPREPLRDRQNATTDYSAPQAAAELHFAHCTVRCRTKVLLGEFDFEIPNFTQEIRSLKMINLCG